MRIDSVVIGYAEDYAVTQLYGARKPKHQSIAVTLLILTDFKDSFTAERLLNFQ